MDKGTIQQQILPVRLKYGHISHVSDSLDAVERWLHSEPIVTCNETLRFIDTQTPSKLSGDYAKAGDAMRFLKELIRLEYKRAYGR